MASQQVAVLILVLVKVVCGSVVSGAERQETLLECGDTLTLDFTNSWPEVHCSSPCSDVHTWTAGPMFKREARLELYGLMVKQEYGKDGVLTCSLVSDITDLDELQSSLQAEACTSSITTTPEGSTGVTASSTTTTITTPEGPAGVTDSITTTTTLESPTEVTGSTTTTREEPTGGTSPTTTAPEATTEVSSSDSPTTEPESSISSVTVESTPLIGCETGSKTPTTVTPTTTESQWVCENGWSLYGSSCYKVDDTVKRDWLQGQIYCNDVNAEYVQITSNDEAQFLKDILSSDAWIGLNDKTTEGNYVWTDGSPATFTQWFKGEPNNVKNEDCTEMRKSMEFWWNDSSCSNKKSVLCEKPASKLVG